VSLNRIRLAVPCLALFSASPLFAQQQTSPPTPAVSIKRNFASVNRRLLAMAEDFPAEKYDYRPTKDVRSFGEVIVHAMSGNVYASKAGRGEKVKWDELDAKNYKGKAEIVSALKKSIADADATLNAVPDEQFAKTLGPWMGVMEHSAEHYGQLVVYYRLNGLVPPESRPKSKTN